MIFSVLKYNILFLIIILLPIDFISLPSISFAQTLSINENTRVVISATKNPTPIDQVASSVTLITAEEIEKKQYRTLADSLKDVPGLSLVQSGGPGGTPTSLFIRGTESSHTKIIVDGIEISDPSQSYGATTFDFSNFLTSDIERIEILRGPQSSLYGSDAIGGVVSIITKNGEGPLKLTGTVEGGSFGTFNQSSSLNGHSGDYGYSFNISHLKVEDIQNTPENLWPLNSRGLSEEPKGTSYDNLTLSTKLDNKITDQLKITFVSRYIETNYNNYNSTYGSDHTIIRNEQFLTRSTVDLSFFNGHFDQTMGIAYTLDRQQVLDANYPPQANSSGDRTKFDWLGIIPLMKGETLSFGYDQTIERLIHNPSTTNSFQLSKNAVFTQLQSTIDDRFYNAMSLRYDDDRRFGNRATWRIAPSYKLLETNTTFKGTIGTGYQTPSLYALLVNVPGVETANPQLKSEKSLGWDAGIEQFLFDKSIQIGSTYFHNSIKNDINSIQLNDGTYSFENVNNVTGFGTENFIAFYANPYFSMRADYTFTLSEDNTTHRQLLRRPKNKLSLSSSWQITDSLSITGGLLYVGSWMDNDPETYLSHQTNGYTTLNLASTYRISPSLSIFTRIDNLLNRHYQNPLGYLQPGLGAYGGIKISY